MTEWKAGVSWSTQRERRSKILRNLETDDAVRGPDVRNSLLSLKIGATLALILVASIYLYQCSEEPVTVFQSNLTAF